MSFQRRKQQIAAPGGFGPRGDAGRVSWERQKLVFGCYDEKVVFSKMFFF